MFTIFVLISFVIVTTFHGDSVQGQVCPRTNPEAGHNCNAKCIVGNGCKRPKRVDCVCDGDCGYSCVKKNQKCPLPFNKRFRNGVSKFDNRRKFNSTVVFKCNPGYNMTGSAVRTCRGNGYWDGTETKCRILCSEPGVGHNLHRYESSKPSGFKVKTSLHYYCTLCYKPQGRATITCMPNGKWNYPPPSCVVQTCPPPNLQKNTKVVIPRNYKKSNDAQCGTRLTLGCESGYTLSMGQRGSLVCDVVGRWKNITTQECQPRSCRDPGHVRNGNRKGLLFHYTSNVSFSCDPCYKLDGPSFRTCQANGKWSDTQPVCKMVKCSKPKTLVNGTEKFVSTDCRSSVVYSCYKGYKLAGSSKRVCGEDGKWTGQEPKCTILLSCGVPKDASLRRRVKIIGTNFHYAATVRFACADGDVIDGNKWAECLENGSWSHETPRCLASCKPPKGVLPEDVFLDREETKFTCPSGKKISGTINTKKVICNAGAWEYEDGKTVKVDEVRCIKEKKTAWNFLGR